MDTKIELTCSKCWGSLNKGRSIVPLSSQLNIAVLPCQACLKKESEVGFVMGEARGYSAGYDAGRVKGLALGRAKGYIDAREEFDRQIITGRG